MRSVPGLTRMKVSHLELGSLKPAPLAALPLAGTICVHAVNCGAGAVCYTVMVKETSFCAGHPQWYLIAICL